MPTGKEIVEKYQVDRVEFVELVKSGKLTARNANTLEPVDWEREELAFTECKKQIAKGPLTVKNPRKPNPFTIGSSNFPQPETSIQRPRIEAKGNQAILWSTLFQKLSNQKDSVPVSPDQYNLIEQGEWNFGTIEIIALESEFSKDEGENLLSSKPLSDIQIDGTKPTGPSRETLLKIIIILSHRLNAEMYQNEKAKWVKAGKDIEKFKPGTKGKAEDDYKDFFPEKGPTTRIVPKKLAVFLQTEASLLDIEDRGLSETSIVEILTEARKRLSFSPDKYFEEKNK